MFMKKIVNVIKKVFLAIWSFILSLFSKSKVKKTNNMKTGEGHRPSALFRYTKYEKNK